MCKKRKGMDYTRMRCPYCGSPVALRSVGGIYKENNRGTMLYVCARYPECDAYVRVQPGTNIPLGSLADRDLRALRNQAHRYFNQLYLSGLMTKENAYAWLSDQISAPRKEAHIGHLGEYYCKLVIDKSRELLKMYAQRKKSAGIRIWKGGKAS